MGSLTHKSSLAAMCEPLGQQGYRIQDFSAESAEFRSAI